MRVFLVVSTLLLATGALAWGAAPPPQAFDWSPWRFLPVQEGGRHKPLDTLARETIQRISGRTRLADPETGRKLDSVALYLTMLFEWQGWEAAPDAPAMSRMHGQAGYYDLYKADRWDRAALIQVDSLELRKALGLDEDRQRFSPLELSKAAVRDPATGETATDRATGQEIPFDRWAKDLVRSRTDFSEFENQALELANKIWLYQHHRAGEGLLILPVKDSPDQLWHSLADLMRADSDGQNAPAGLLRAKEHFQKARAAYRAGQADAFRKATTAFLAAVRETGSQLGPYPSKAAVDLEVAYNRASLFSLAWVFSLIVVVALLASMATRWKGLMVAGLATYAACLIVMLIGFVMRGFIRQWVPVTNLYESVVFAAFGALVFGLIFGLLARKLYVFAAAALVATLALLLADFCPSVLDPRIRPLMPVLRSNYWLTVHVVTIMLSYAVFALAWILGNVALTFYLKGGTHESGAGAFARLVYKTLQAGVLLLIVGTFLGAAWADDSWGRFWGWDPKEVWALITLLGYLAVLHARSAGWIGPRGLVAWSVACFSLVVITWYLANMLPGLHEYGLGGGGPYFVCGAIILQLLYVLLCVAAAIARSAVGRQTGLDQASPAG